MSGARAVRGVPVVPATLATGLGPALESLLYSDLPVSRSRCVGNIRRRNRTCLVESSTVQ
jgi:hypothetical protein